MIGLIFGCPCGSTKSVLSLTVEINQPLQLELDIIRYEYTTTMKCIQVLYTARCQSSTVCVLLGCFTVDC